MCRIKGAIGKLITTIMSNEKVQKLLLAEQQKKAENDALMRYKVLSHFGLGKVEYFRQGENYDDYPIIQNNK